MPNYLAVVKPHRTGQTVKLYFDKPDVVSAFDEMLRQTSCRTVHEVKEFSLYQMLEGNSMVEVRHKYAAEVSRSTGVSRKETIPPVLDTDKLESREEQTYNSYRVATT